MSEGTGQTGFAREFQPIEDRAEGLRLLREGSRTVASTMVWTKNQEQVIHSNLTLLSDIDGTLHIRVPHAFDLRKFEDALASKKTSDCFFSVSLLTANIFFKCEYLGADKDELSFRLPSLIYKVQRRQNLRFPIPNGYVLKVEFSRAETPDTRITHKVLDISAGGLSFIATESEASGFSRGSKLAGVSFTLSQRKITTDAEVRHAGPLPEIKRKAHPNRKDAWRVGVEFTSIRQGDQQAIAAYVFEESRKFFTRFA